jgi:hypothetical protein
MAISHLKLVDGGIYQIGGEPKGTAERVRELQQQARLLAREQVEELQAALAHVAALAKGVAEAGEVVPAGVRDIAGRLATDLPDRAQQMQPLVERFWDGPWPSKLLL